MSRCVLLFFEGLAAVLALHSCAEPLVESAYMRSGDAPECGRYVFDLNLTDSLSTYTLSFYSVADCPGPDCTLPDLDLRVGLKSPSGREYGETVILPAGMWHSDGRMQTVLREVYRDGFVPSEYGVWKMELDVSAACEGLCGMGYELERKKYGKGQTQKIQGK